MLVIFTQILLEDLNIWYSQSSLNKHFGSKLKRIQCTIKIILSAKFGLDDLPTILSLNHSDVNINIVVSSSNWQKDDDLHIFQQIYNLLIILSFSSHLSDVLL